MIMKTENDNSNNHSDDSAQRNPIQIFSFEYLKQNNTSSINSSSEKEKRQQYLLNLNYNNDSIQSNLFSNHYKSDKKSSTPSPPRFRIKSPNPQSQFKLLPTSPNEERIGSLDFKSGEHQKVYFKMPLTHSTEQQIQSSLSKLKNERLIKSKKKQKQDKSLDDKKKINTQEKKPEQLGSGLKAYDEVNLKKIPLKIHYLQQKQGKEQIEQLNYHSEKSREYTNQSEDKKSRYSAANQQSYQQLWLQQKQKPLELKVDDINSNLQREYHEQYLVKRNSRKLKELKLKQIQIEASIRQYNSETYNCSNNIINQQQMSYNSISKADYLSPIHYSNQINTNNNYSPYKCLALTPTHLSNNSICKHEPKNGKACTCSSCFPNQAQDNNNSNNNNSNNGNNSNNNNTNNSNSNNKNKNIKVHFDTFKAQKRSSSVMNDKYNNRSHKNYQSDCRGRRLTENKVIIEVLKPKVICSFETRTDSEWKELNERLEKAYNRHQHQQLNFNNYVDSNSIIQSTNNSRIESNSHELQANEIREEIKIRESQHAKSKIMEKKDIRLSNRQLKLRQKSSNERNGKDHEKLESWKVNECMELSNNICEYNNISLTLS